MLKLSTYEKNLTKEHAKTYERTRYVLKLDNLKKKKSSNTYENIYIYKRVTHLAHLVSF